MATSVLSSLEAFNRDVDLFTRNLSEKHLLAFHKKIIFDFLRGVMKKTPVDEGRARGAWRVSVGVPSEEVIEVVRPRFAAMAEAATALANLRPFQVVWISNNVPYILYLEEGSSKQAPQGMVSLTIEEMRTMFP